MPALCSVVPVALQLIPARGRKPTVDIAVGIDTIYYNLSPQGDGNLPNVTYASGLHYYNLSPQGDGNLRNANVFVRYFITTYPRKGTVTSRSLLTLNFSSHYNLSPQGDGNIFPWFIFMVSAHYNLSPQGDGNLGVHVDRHRNIDYNFSPQGDKKAPPRWYKPVRRGFAFQILLFWGQRVGVPAGMAASTGIALMPCGTFRFRGRISCR